MRYLILFLLLISCSARKTETVKEIDKLKESEISVNNVLEFKNSTDKSLYFVKEYYNDGTLKKESYTQKNKIKNERKKVEFRTYRTITTYKSIYKKNTQKEAVSVWVWVAGFLLIFIFALIKFRK